MGTWPYRLTNPTALGDRATHDPNRYYNDPNAPRANTLVPAASAIVTDQHGRILLHRRSDNQLWSIPGGTMEIGETIRDTVIREVKEETGLDVEPERLVGIYSDPSHLIAYSNGEVRQQFSVCFACRLLGGHPTRSDESPEVGFFTHAQIEQMPVHPSIRLRIAHLREPGDASHNLKRLRFEVM